ncbi:MAG: C13 family peptidase [Sphingomonas sp.]
MRFSILVHAIALLLAPLAVASPAAAQQAAPYQPPQHTSDWPGLVTGKTQDEVTASLDRGPDFERGRSAKWLLADHRRVEKALTALAPQRKGVVDAYVISIALDSDPVFGREAREAGKVLAHRFDAAGRTLVFAGSNGAGPSELPAGNLETLTLALARVAEVMDRNEDVLVLYSTSHGAKVGIAYHDGDEGFGLLSPARLAAVLDELGIKNRVLILSACYSGIFVPAVASDTTALFTAASADRPSFGCRAENDWTFFGDAMINHALRDPQPLAAAADEARGLIAAWEHKGGLDPSNPQISIGSGVDTWLKPLEARMPKTATDPVGRPATDALAPGN